MPELPEVELISRSLNSLLRGRTIASAELLRARLAPDLTGEGFWSALCEVTINRVRRRGKHILFDLSNERTLIVHLRMSGRFSLLSEDCENPKFTHAVFYLDNAERLVFDDQRHFGFMKIAMTEKLDSTKELAKLAPEPFSVDFSPEYLYGVSRSSRRSLKELLLDQTKVCGVGNIYACEAMYMARLDPRKRAARLSKARAAALHGSIRQVLATAIAYAEDRAVDPRNLEGSYFSGLGDTGWFVYDREGQTCLDCGDLVRRLKQAGRSTFFCRQCQSG